MTELKGLGPKVVIHCPEEENAIEVCKLFQGAGFKWNSGREYSEITNWGTHQENTCYNPYAGQYGEIRTYRGYTILAAKDFLAMNQPEKQVSVWEHPEIQNALLAFHSRLAELGSHRTDSLHKVAYDLIMERRKPKFELKCKDGVIVNDPEQEVWTIRTNGELEPFSARDARYIGVKECWASKEGAQNHLKKTAQKICLEDLEGIIPDSAYFQIEKLVNQRMK